MFKIARRKQRSKTTGDHIGPPVRAWAHCGRSGSLPNGVL